MADFVLGRIKFKWRGDWAVSTAYLIDDIVKYGGNTYVVTENHTSQSTVANFYTDLSASKYSLHTEGLFFKGDWAASTFYRLNDLVKNGAYQYRCILQYTSGGSFSIGSNWQVFTEGLQWEDSYNAGTTYQDGDVVSYGGYVYVYINATPASGQTPTDNAYWDIVTTGFKPTGTYNFATTYKTGDFVNYGGNSYVANANHSGQYPAVQATGAVNSSYWNLVTTGFFYRGSYSNVTTYNISDVVLYEGTSYIQLKDRQLNVTPGTDATVWKVVAQGDAGNVLSEAGDMIIMNQSLAAERLNLGPAGSILTSNGTIPEWRYDEGSRNVLYVSNSGNDSTGTGAKTLPFKTIKAALAVSGKGDILELSAVSGGSGGTGGVFTVSTFTTSGSGTGAVFQITIDGSSAPTLTNVIIVNGGKNFAAGDTVTITGSSQLGGATNMTLTILNVNFGDLIWVKTGSYREQLPLVVPANVCVRGEALRSVEVRPATGNSSTIATVSYTSGGIGGTTFGTFKYKHQNSTSGTGSGVVANIVRDGSSTPTIAIYHGGYKYQVGDTITILGTQIGNCSDLVFTVTALEANNASYMWLLNDGTNLRLMTLRGMTGTSTHLTANTGFGGAVVVSLDPEGAILTQSPYCQDMTSINSGGVGVKIDGLLHTNASSNKSILGTHFTQINSDGIGVWCHGNGRAEMVSVFTYFCAKSYFASEGGFIRGLNGSSVNGEKGAVAEGTLVAETPVGVQGNGEMLEYNPTTFGGAATESTLTSAITTNGSGTATVLGLTSGATATFFRYNTALDYIHIKNRSGNFQKSETIRITAQNSSTFTVNLDADFGPNDSTNVAQQCQIGPLISVKTGTTALTSAGLIKVGTNIKFAGNSTHFKVNAVTEENTSAGTATVRLTSYVTRAGGAIDNNEVGNITSKFSNVRLTGHDFLDIGTGDIITSNYPGVPTQPADQEDEVEELDGGRVYFVSTDQSGDFRVGDLFRIQQATGIATLNADAFDLSGLSELQLGSLGAELGVTINEFSSDETLGGNSNSAVPTEFAIVGYTQRDQMGVGHFVPPTGTTAERPTGGDLKTGGVRFNSSLVTWEGYNGTQWTGLGGGNPWASTATSITITANDRYFVDTTTGAKTITLPASPQLGDQISILDLASTFDTNNCTIARNGNKIMGLSENLILSTEDAGITLVYTGSTYGWKLVTNI